MSVATKNIENKSAKVVLGKYSAKMNFNIIQSLKVNMNERGLFQRTPLISKVENYL